RLYGGSGLGLAICSKLAGLMGGKLELQNKDGPGSLFCLHLDLPCGTLESLPTVNLPEDCTVFVVDNSAGWRHVLSSWLRDLGIVCHTFANSDPWM
ncbi:ATP-binding protein, partial [Arthrospira platensis SPKY1]|nr:ATP-binding protein [Arthrospira platensis SPKY1]